VVLEYVSTVLQHHSHTCNLESLAKEIVRRIEDTIARVSPETRPISRTHNDTTGSNKQVKSWTGCNFGKLDSIRANVNKHSPEA
jgi:hypothetical protein